MRTTARTVSALAAAVLLLPVAATARPEASLRVRDQTRDVRSRDLDIVSASITRASGVLTARIELARPVRDDAVYSLLIARGGNVVQVGARRAAGKTSYFVLRPDYSQAPAQGSMKGRIVTVSTSTAAVGVGNRSFRFHLAAEATNSRATQVDRAPNGQAKLRFPAG